MIDEAEETVAATYTAGVLLSCDEIFLKDSGEFVENPIYQV